MTYVVLFIEFFKIGLFTFGGGYAMLPLVEEVVTKYGWLTLDELINFLAISESTPGPFAVNVSTYIGMKTAGIGGAVAATTGVVFPSFLIISIVAGCYIKFKNNRKIQGALTAIRPATVGLIAAAMVTVGKTVFFTGGIETEVFDGRKFCVSVVFFLLASGCSYKKIHPIFIILISAVFGVFLQLCFL